MELGHVYPRARLCGCDLSEAARSGGACFYKLDAENLQDFPGGERFGLVTCCEVLEHCARPENVVQNAYQWLDKGGVLFVSVPSGPMTGYDRAIGHRHHYAESEVQNLLQSQGFQSVTTLSWGFPFHSIYRSMVGIASSNLSGKDSNPGKFFWPFWFFSKIFNLLFYLNLFKKGRQIFAWGCR